METRPPPLDISSAILLLIIKLFFLAYIHEVGRASLQLQTCLIRMLPVKSHFCAFDFPTKKWDGFIRAYSRNSRARASFSWVGRRLRLIPLPILPELPAIYRMQKNGNTKSYNGTERYSTIASKKRSTKHQISSTIGASHSNKVLTAIRHVG